MTDLLNDYKLTIEREHDHYGFTTGEVRLSLDFAEGVEYDVDAGPDGDVIIQYWETDE